MYEFIAARSAVISEASTSITRTDSRKETRVVALSEGPDLVSGEMAANNISAVSNESRGISINDFPVTMLEQEKQY